MNDSDNVIQPTISNFIPSQFPPFYLDEGPKFVEFVRMYYQWLEQTNNIIGQARALPQILDIDTTPEELLGHFAFKYLSGFPESTASNTRFVIKHILDLYRSKGSIPAFKLLFRILYNVDIQVYLPKLDIFKASDGTWTQPRYIEITDNGNLQKFVGQQIFGVSSGTTAVVESLVTEKITYQKINTLYISNISPPGRAFIQGEKITLLGEEDSNSVANGPLILGSLATVKILNGGQGFVVGDLMKISHDNPYQPTSSYSGTNGIVRVTAVTRGYGQLTYTILNGGSYYTTNSSVFVLNSNSDLTGQGGNFKVGSIGYIRNVTYNSDLLCDYANVQIGASAYGFPKNFGSNLGTTIGSALTYITAPFGSITTLTDIDTGSNYTQPANVVVQSIIAGRNPLQGTINVSTTSPVVVGTGTLFTNFFTNNGVIIIGANTNSTEQHLIKTVANNTYITLYDNPTFANSAGIYKCAPLLLAANFFPEDPIYSDYDGTIPGDNAVISAIPSVGTGVIGSVVAVDSGKGFSDDEVVYLYLYNNLNLPSIDAGGIGYSNGDALIFTGDPTQYIATGYVTTDLIGSVTAAVLTYGGCGYTNVPSINIKSTHGTGAILSTTIADFSPTSIVTGQVVRAGVGTSAGYWTSTRGFMNSDKYLQDSYYYQDYSYELQTPLPLEQYKPIIYDGFHTTGCELFGSIRMTDSLNSNTSNILFESNSMTIKIG